MPRHDYDLIVLGAGVVGVNTAYWAQRAGKSVCLIDRQPEAGLETSFANGGQISVSHAEPWANPAAPVKIAKWLFDPKAPLLFRPRLDPAQWRWIAQFMVDCLPHRADRHTAQIVRLALDSRNALREIRARENLSYDQRLKGIIHFYRNQRDFDDACHAAEVMRRHGCELQVIGRDRVVELEPAFAARRDEIVGATYTPDDESGDAMKYTQALAAICRERGMATRYSSDIVALRPEAGRIGAVEIRTPRGYETVRGRDVVVSMGSYSAPFLRRCGINLNIYPAKGYSATIPIDESCICPTVSLTDDENKLVYSNLGDRLRVAGTAELSGYDRALNPTRCAAIVDKVRELFPDAGDFEQARFWTGLRPTTPSNVPYIGPTRFANLWLNTGHGTLGWTMGAGSGRRIVELIAAADRPRARLGGPAALTPTAAGA
jgi:D-amino-acid dehydrogenase